MPKAVDNVNDDGDVVERVHALMHRCRTLQYRALRDGPHTLTHMESKVLGYYARHAGATQSDLAAHSGRDKAQLARLIKGLRERGLLAAEADTDDRRNVRLTLTDAGRALQQALRRKERRLRSRAVAGLSADERALLAALLERVRRNLDDGDTG